MTGLDHKAVLSGYDADRELLAAATLQGSASSANDILGHCDLSITQLKSMIALLARVAADPNAGDLVTPAKQELAEAKALLQAVHQHGC